jgi:subtilisin family serine protease
MSRSSWRHRAVLAALLVALSDGAFAESGPTGRVRTALEALCGNQAPTAARLAADLDGARIEDERVDDIGGAPGRWRAVLALDDGGRLHLNRLYPGGRLRRLTVAYHEPVPSGGTRPRLQATATADCAVIDARRLGYDAAGRAETLAILAADLETVTGQEPLNPPVPTGRDPGGVTVALFDSGINYTLPHLAGRLARGPAGRLIGYDYWDSDDRPYDSDTRGSPFFPLHHGSVVAGLLVAEAPAVRLAPYRYPNPDLGRMPDMVAAAEAAGAIIVSMPMGSNRPGDWTAFRDAAAARPDMLFVLSAGNDGRDIDRDPVYPAAFDLGNFLVVTSATPFGKLAPGSNWGLAHVDLMVPAEQLPVIDHRGAAGKASGSSYAVPRIAALAARLRAAHPDWRAAELKAAILARAHPSPYQRTRVTRYGWIANPADDR